MSEIEGADEVDRRITELVLEGLSNRSIARHVGLPEGTVKWRLHRLYRRLDVQTRVQFVNEIRRRRESGS